MKVVDIDFARVENASSDSLSVPVVLAKTQSRFGRSSILGGVRWSILRVDDRRINNINTATADCGGGKAAAFTVGSKTKLADYQESKTEPTMCRLSLSLMILLAWCAPIRPKDPKPAPNSDFEKVLSELRESGKRVNGVQLTIKAELKHDATQGIDLIQINWTLDYDGPRPPLVIQKPIYPEFSYYATRIRVFAPGNSALVPTVILEGREPLGEYRVPPAAEAFVTVEKGRATSGVITVPVGVLKYELINKWPKEIGDKPPTAVYIQLLHFPRERGEELGLDAWTVGTPRGSGLYSGPAKVKLSKW